MNLKFATQTLLFKGEKMIKKSIMLKMLMLFVSSSLFIFSQQNEIYNKIQINVASKNPTKDAKTSFGGFFNEDSLF